MLWHCLAIWLRRWTTGGAFFLEVAMIKSRRRPVHKGRSVRRFRRNVRKTHIRNVKAVPMRGGWRL